MVKTWLIISPIIIISVITIYVLYQGYKEYNLSLKRYTVRKHKIDVNILKIFESPTSQIKNISELDIDETLDIIPEQDMDEKSKDEFMFVPKELLKFSFLLNPVRLSIMKLLSIYTQFQETDLRKELNISWGKVVFHINKLQEKGFIESYDEFIDGSPRKIIRIADQGLKVYSELEKILNTIVKNQIHSI